MFDYVLMNAKIINEGRITEEDIAIKEGRIARIDQNISSLPAKRVIDLQGKYLMPGMIDDQVHFREPGMPHKGDIFTESRAAVAGGITSYMEMPNTNPPTLDVAALQEKKRRAAQKSLANYAFYLGTSTDNLEQVKRITPEHACGIKIFMGSSTGNMCIDDPAILEQFFAHAPILVATHCEDDHIIKQQLDYYQSLYGNNIPIALHPYIRSHQACYQSSLLAVSLARRYQTKLHVLHLTTAHELSLFDAGHHRNKRITLEACVHHLFFNEQDYARLGTRIKCNPAIKKRADQQALLTAVQQDRIDVIATDHAPHSWQEKQQAYTQAPAGLPLVQHALLSLFELQQRYQLDLPQIVTKACHAPADIYGVQQRGYIREGYWADITVVDMHQPYYVHPGNIAYKCGWSPFTGHRFPASIHHTFVNGKLAYDQGRICETGSGMALEFRYAS